MMNQMEKASCSTMMVQSTKVMFQKDNQMGLVECYLMQQIKMTLKQTLKSMKENSGQDCLMDLAYVLDLMEKAMHMKVSGKLENSMEVVFFDLKKLVRQLTKVYGRKESVLLRLDDT